MGKINYLNRKLNVDNVDVNVGDVGLVNTAETPINPATEDKQDTIISNQTNGTQKTKLYSNNADVDTQHPLPTDGDSVYTKDINVSGSDIGTFTGDIISLVDDLDTTFSSTGHSSPAYFSIKFERPITNNGVKFCSPVGKSFKNTKITLKDRAGTVLFVIDESTKSTAKSSEEYYWPHISYCTMLVEFYTTDDIDINWALLEKSQLVHMNKKFIDESNSFEKTMAPGEVWTGNWVRTYDFVQALIDVITTQDGAADALKVQLSKNGITTFHPHNFSIYSNSPDGHHYASSLELYFMRIVYTNGPTTADVKVATTLFTDAVETGHVHSLNYNPGDDHQAEIVRAILTGKNPQGVYTNVQTTSAGNIKTSVEELETVVINQLSRYLSGTGANGSVTLTNADTAYAVPPTPVTNSCIINLYNGDDTEIKVGFQNIATNGIPIYPTGNVEEQLGPGQQLYVYCASAGKIMTYTLKEVQ